MTRVRSLLSAAGLAAFALRPFVLALLVSFLAPRAAMACSVCRAGRDDESNTAFLIPTTFLSVPPLAGLGTLVFVLWRRIQRLEAETPPSADERAVSQVAGA